MFECNFLNKNEIKYITKLQYIILHSIHQKLVIQNSKFQVKIKIHLHKIANKLDDLCNEI